MKTEAQLKIKKTFLIFLCVIMSIGILAQDKNGQNKANNEFKINMGSLLFEFPEISYEYIISEESAVGVSFAFPIDRDISYRFIVYPNYRLYFGKKRAAGFFIEGNAAIYSQQEQKSTFTISENANTNVKKMGFGMGLAIGGKFLTKNGFIGELYIGGGRNFMNTDYIDGGYPRIGISIGKRF